MSDWKTDSSKIVYETPWFKIHEDKVRNQLDRPLTYSYMELQRPSVFIVATNDKGEILIQSVYRYTVQQRLWEIPAGMMDEGEEAIDAAKRELMEEAGLISDDWIALGRIYQIVGTGNVPLEAFLARNTSDAGKATDEDEDIEKHTFKSLADIETMISKGELVDGAVIAALYMAKLRGLEKEADQKTVV
ncbi:MAG: NUDIX hydrolase [Candidatus Saccharimonadales bacterium]